MKKSLYLLLLLLFPIGLQAQSEVIVLHPDEGKAEVNEAEYTKFSWQAPSTWAKA